MHKSETIQFERWLVDEGPVVVWVEWRDTRPEELVCGEICWDYTVTFTAEESAGAVRLLRYAAANWLDSEDAISCDEITRVDGYLLRFEDPTLPFPFVITRNADSRYEERLNVGGWIRGPYVAREYCAPLAELLAEAIGWLTSRSPSPNSPSAFGPTSCGVVRADPGTPENRQ